MVLVTSNKTRQLLVITFVAEVLPTHFTDVSADIRSLLSDLQPGFSLLVDLTYLRTMSEECAPQISDVMDLCDEKGVGRVIRIIPDPAKDIGLTILSRFHYPHKPRMILCESFSEAAKHLSG
jgi:hypothetical protein